MTISEWKKALGNKANIIPIYISEAHANDEWPASADCSISQHKNLQDRIEKVKKGMGKYGINFPIYVDSMNPVNFESIYKPWPERAFIFYQDKVQYIAKAEIEGIFWHDEVPIWFKENLNIEIDSPF